MSNAEKHTPNCERCRLRAHARERPNSWKARLWRWHTRWCPGWKAYQRQRQEEGLPLAEV